MCRQLEPCMKIFRFCFLSLFCAGAAHAVHVSPDRTGQVLLYPYYTANAGNQTLLTVVNHTNAPKLLKVRFHESRNGRTVQSLNLFLGANDIWTAAIFALDQGSDAPALLQTSDSSCVTTDASDAIVSTIGASRYRFSNAGYNGALDDAASNTLDRTREGHIEIIEMATILSNSETGKALRKLNGASDCTAIRLSSNVDGSYGNSGFGTLPADFVAPSGYLSGTGAIVDAAKGTLLNYGATALDGFRTQAFYTRAGSEEPNLSHADPKSAILLPSGQVEFVWGGELVGGNSATGQRIDAVSSVLMASTINNEYSVETSLSAQTEWVISFPTKRFYIDPRLSGVSNRISPFLSAGGTFLGRLEDSMNCVPFSYGIQDRNERFEGPSTIVNLGLPPSPHLCGSTSIVRFRKSAQPGGFSEGYSDSPMLSGKFELNLEAFESGSASLFITRPVGNSNTPYALRPAIGTDQPRILGLPVIGFSAIRFENRNAMPNIQGFYDGAYDHIRIKSCLKGEIRSFTCN